MLKFDPQWSVYGSVFNSLLQAGDHLGANRLSLLSELEWLPEELSQSDQRFPVHQLYQLYERVEKHTQCPDVGLYVGRIAYTNGLNLQLYMSTISKSFRDYLNLMPSILKLWGDIGTVTMQVDDDLLCMTWQPLLEATRYDRYFSDAFMSVSAAKVGSVCVRPINVVKAYFSYPEPDDTRLLRDFFGEQLVFDQPASCLFFSREALNYGMSHLDHELTSALTDPLRHLFNEPTAADQFLQTLRTSIVRLLPTGTMNIDDIARELNVSKRTLQRRLSDRNTQFQQVVLDIRNELSLRYLADKRLSLAEVAFLIGYADQSTFSSAFKSWHGCSPSRYRG